MEADEPRTKSQGTLSGMDLGPMSIAELEARIATLRAEIIRCEEAILAKKKFADAASAVFRI